MNLLAEDGKWALQLLFLEGYLYGFQTEISINWATTSAVAENRILRCLKHYDIAVIGLDEGPLVVAHTVHAIWSKLSFSGSG